jgi:CheY-like chemotaxis protein
MFAVTDTGINVSSSEMADIVQIFFVEENAVSETYFTKYDGGIRLGLRICKELCELMGSRMIVRSDSGKGTIFEFSLTFGLLETELEEEPDLDREYKILIAEDHPINQKILARLLAKDGYTSEVANNGAEAVRMIVSGSYDAVLMDLEMPILSGMDATRRVREMEAERGMIKLLPIIGVSGNSREEYMPKCLKAGMQGYITKPYVHQDIFDALAQCLRPRRVV